MPTPLRSHHESSRGSTNPGRQATQLATFLLTSILLTSVTAARAAQLEVLAHKANGQVHDNAGEGLLPAQQYPGVATGASSENVVGPVAPGSAAAVDDRPAAAHRDLQQLPAPESPPLGAPPPVETTPADHQQLQEGEKQQLQKLSESSNVPMQGSEAAADVQLGGQQVQPAQGVGAAMQAAVQTVLAASRATPQQSADASNADSSGNAASSKPGVFLGPLLLQQQQQQQQQASGASAGLVAMNWPGMQQLSGAAALAMNAATTGSGEAVSVTANDGGVVDGGFGGRGGGLALWLRVLGGQQAHPTQYRFIASLRDSYGRHFCGGSLVAPQVVLTAAHCVDQPSDPSLANPVVHVGRYFTDKSDSRGYDVRRCETSIVHPGWSLKHGRNDLALCLLNSPSSRPTVMVASGTLRMDGATPLSIVGFGATAQGAGNNDVLEEAVVFPQDLNACNKTYGGLIWKGQLCAGRALGGVDACQGDSGGPLLLPKGTAASVFTASSAFTSTASSSSSASTTTSNGLPPGSDQDLLVGVVSWGRGCGIKGQPGVYTNLVQYRTWINQQLAKYQLGPLPVPVFPSASQMLTLINSKYACQSQPSQEDLAILSQSLANQGLELQTALDPVLAAYGCKPKSVTKAPTSSSTPSPSSSNKKPAPKPAPNPPAKPKTCPDGSKPQKNGKCPSKPDPCSCTTDGRSGSTVTPLVGCQQHGASVGDYLYYCMVAGGVEGCGSAVPSRVYQGAAWLECSPTVTSSKTTGGAATGSGGSAASGGTAAGDGKPAVSAFNGVDLEGAQTLDGGNVAGSSGSGSGGGSSGKGQQAVGGRVLHNIFTALLGRR